MTAFANVTIATLMTIASFMYLLFETIMWWLPYLDIADGFRTPIVRRSIGPAPEIRRKRF